MRPATLLLAALAALGCARAAPDPAVSRQPAPERRILVFAKTAGFRHSSIPAGKAAILRLGRENGFVVDTTEDASRFTPEGLAPYRAVVFLSTTGNVLDEAQQAAFERFVRAGGGFVGVHAAADTEYDWPWYGRLVGGYFASHPNNPNVRRGTFVVADRSHPATTMLPERWEREDEFYNFKQLNPATRVILRIDETTYQGGTNGPEHPMAWHHAYDGGRAFYTALGHTDASFAEPLFLAHLLGGIRWAMGLTTG
jgi:cytochrome c